MLSGRPRTGWEDGAKRVVNERGVSVEQRSMILYNRSEWRAVVNV